MNQRVNLLSLDANEDAAIHVRSMTAAIRQ